MSKTVTVIVDAEVDLGDFDTSDLIKEVCGRGHIAVRLNLSSWETERILAIIASDGGYRASELLRGLIP